MRTTLTAALMGVCAGLAGAQVRLPAVIGSNMVLQQSAKAPIWGWAAPEQEVSVRGSWMESAAKTVADGKGRWMVRLETPSASAAREPVTVALTAGGVTTTLTNVLIGEVWLASGQSNMEWPLRASEGGEAAIAGSNLARVRLLNVRNVVAARAQEDCTTEGGWRASTAGSAADFSAVAQYFARELQGALDVPIGLIEADWGGTPVEAWSSAETISKFPKYAGAMAGLELLDPDPNVRAAKLAKSGFDWWSGLDGHRKGAGREWAGPGFKDDAWKTVTLPAAMTADGLDRFDGVLYFRRRVTLPAELAGAAARLELGPIDDRDDAYVNGVRVGGTHEDGRWNQDRAYEVPAKVLRGGENTIAVRVLDTGGIAGINGKAEQMRLVAGERSVALAGEWKFRAGAALSELPPIGEPGSIGPGTPTSLYNGMIHPVIPYAIRGVIWYQGESNRGDAETYASLFPAMIRQWRGDWRARNADQPEFAFLFTQIAPFNYGGDSGQTAELRDAQTHALRTTPNTGMAVTMDIGNPADIHPRNKLDVGRRLARWALAGTYGKSEVVACGPEFRGVRAEGDAAVVTFDLHGSRGLAADGPLKDFAVAGADHVFYAGTAAITGPNTVKVTSARVPIPVDVRYGWCNACEPNLKNAEGLPAIPFRSDNLARPEGGWPEPRASALPGVAPPEAGSTEGFTALYNGRDFGGWKFEKEHEGHFVARGPVIAFDGQGKDLWTEKAYRDFVLRVDWRWTTPASDTARPVILPTGEEKKGADGKVETVVVKDAGDSGVYLRGSSKSQVNIWCWPIGSGEVYGYRTDGSQPAEVRAGVTPRVAADAPIGAWNRFEITMQGESLTVVLNGKTVLEKARLPGVAAEGPIALQKHDGAIEFANLWIKELK